MNTKRFPVEERNGRLFFRGADLGATDRWPGWFGDYGGIGHTAERSTVVLTKLGDTPR
jgi:hypothetical protein